MQFTFLQKLRSFEEYLFCRIFSNGCFYYKHQLDKKPKSEWPFRGKHLLLDFKGNFFWTGVSCDLQYKKLIFLFKNLYMVINVLNDFVNKFVCMFVCNGTFLLQILEWFEFQRFLQTSDLDITSQFSSHLTKATSLLKTIWNLKQRMDYDFQRWI